MVSNKELMCAARIGSIFCFTNCIKEKIFDVANPNLVRISLFFLLLFT